MVIVLNKKNNQKDIQLIITKKNYTDIFSSLKIDFLKSSRRIFWITLNLYIGYVFLLFYLIEKYSKAIWLLYAKIKKV